MGCLQSTNTDRFSTENTFPDLNEWTEVPVVDSKVPLSVREIFKLKQSWREIRRHLTAAGIEMFIG